MAAGGFKTFTAGDVLTAADTNDFLMQGILVFDDDTARDAAVTSPVEGQFCFLKDTDTTQVYDGTDWVETGGGAIGGAAITDTPTGNYVDGGVTYDYWTYNSSGTLTVNTAGFADVLVVGGGGGAVLGGGGGGGVLYAAQAYLAAGSTTVSIGAGGAAYGYNGISSRLGSFYGVGGGGQNYYHTDGTTSRHNGQPGGSGGGSGTTVAASQGTGLSGQGNDGGIRVDTGMGGGGGAGAIGSNGSGTTGGNGGVGISNSITGTAVLYGPGGGGGGSGTGGTGGATGGGNGNTTTGATAGTANTGGGGGGGNSPGGKAGGSGVVIVRVRTA